MGEGAQLVGSLQLPQRQPVLVDDLGLDWLTLRHTSKGIFRKNSFQWLGGSPCCRLSGL